MEVDILKNADLKSTKKRRLILSILNSENNPLTAEEIYERTKNKISMNQSTIYRALNTLTEKNIVIKNLYQNGKTYYQLKRHNHNHRLICSICGNTVQIDECPLKELENKLENQTGYTITGHYLEFMGICPHCIENKE